MDLHPDEGYYWQMSRFMDWGYFHQPPMIAVFIKVGYAIFHNELGVRLITVLASSIGVLLLFGLSSTQNVKTFLFVYLGMALSHAGVFMAVPDSPLIFFTLVFLVVLRSYLKKDTLLGAIGLGLLAALLVYSKYHAVVLFASVLIAVPKLFLRKSFWLTILVAVALFLPHILWQFEHDLVSFKFHWVARDKGEEGIGLLFNYLLGQFLLLGPVGLVLVIAIIKGKRQEGFSRLLLYVIIGVFVFFLLLSLRGRVEANWTAIGFIALIILGTRTIDNNMQRWLSKVAPFMIGLLLIARVFLLLPISGNLINANFPFDGWNAWASAIKDRSEDRPVVFTGSYQYASMYSFYSGDQAYHFSPLNYNGNQFELWNLEKQIEGKPFLLVAGIGQDPLKAIVIEGFDTLRVFKLDNFHSFRNLRFEFDEKEFDVEPNSTFSLSGQMVNKTDATLNIDSLISERHLKTFYYFSGKQTSPQSIQCIGCDGKLDSGMSKPITFLVEVPEKPGAYFSRIGLDFAIAMPEHNSDFFKLNVTEE